VEGLQRKLTEATQSTDAANKTHINLGVQLHRYPAMGMKTEKLWKSKDYYCCCFVTLFRITTPKVW